MKKNSLVILTLICIMMSLFVGILIGFSIGLNSRKDTIINGDTYEYYQNEQFYEEYKLQPFEIRLKLLVKGKISKERKY